MRLVHPAAALLALVAAPTLAAPQSGGEHEVEYDIVAGQVAARGAHMQLGGVGGQTAGKSDHVNRIDILSYSWSGTRPGAKGGNVEFEWKVEEGESAPPPRGGVRVAAGDVDGDGRAAIPGAALQSSTDDKREAASARPAEKRQHNWRPTSKPAAKGSVWVRVATPWAGCRIGARYPSLALNDGAKRYLLQDVVVSSCGGTRAADDRPTEEVAFYYNRISFNY